MPPKRSTRASTGRQSGTQSTLSFASRTKPGSTATNASNRITKPSSQSTTAAAADRAAKAEKQLKGAVLPQAAEPISTIDVKVDPEAADEGHEEEVELEEDETTQALDVQLAAARKLSARQISAYWTAREKLRKAPRVHQRELSVHEKVLREFDMSAQFGPSTGIKRSDRWKRAFALGLNPPLEVLGVLVQADEAEQTAASPAKKAAASKKKPAAAKSASVWQPEKSIVEDLMSSRIGTGVEV